jgi:hypothetical protein
MASQHYEGFQQNSVARKFHKIDAKLCNSVNRENNSEDVR